MDYIKNVDCGAEEFGLSSGGCGLLSMHLCVFSFIQLLVRNIHLRKCARYWIVYLFLMEHMYCREDRKVVNKYSSSILF